MKIKVENVSKNDKIKNRSDYHKRTGEKYEKESVIIIFTSIGVNRM